MQNRLAQRRFGPNLLKLACLLIIGVIVPVLRAQAPPSQDTFVSNVTPRANYGSGITLVVGPGTTSYLQFNLSGVPTGATVNKAVLRLFVDGVLRTGSFDVYQLNSSWNENTLTFNSPAPTLGDSATGNHLVSITSGSANQFLLIDITPLVQGWLSGAIPNNGVALALTSANGTFSFDSKESLLTGNGPELELAFVSQGPQGPPGPQGPMGATGPTGSAGPQGIPGPAGAQGPQGIQGISGPPGINGSQGPKGDTGPQGPGFTFRGPFSLDAEYAINDVVTYNGSTYVATVANRGEDTPDINPIWTLMARQGATGPTGPSGPQGPIGFGLTGPQGPQGVQGPQGPPGPGANPVMLFTVFLPGDLRGLTSFAWIVPDRPIVITRVTAGGNAGGECVQYPQVAVTYFYNPAPFEFTPVGEYDLTLDGSGQGIASIWDSGPISVSIGTGQKISISNNTGSGCSPLVTGPHDVNVTVQYVMQ